MHVPVRPGGAEAAPDQVWPLELLERALSVSAADQVYTSTLVFLALFRFSSSQLQG